jgi:hypothetical protein
VFAVATAEQIEPYRAWGAGAAAPPRTSETPGEYTGRHRTGSRRSWSVRRLFYLPRHLRLR